MKYRNYHFLILLIPFSLFSQRTISDYDSMLDLNGKSISKNQEIEDQKGSKKNKKNKPYKTLRKAGISRAFYTFKGVSAKNEIRIRFKRNGADFNYKVQSVTLFSECGDELKGSYGFKNLQFPFKARVNFNAPIEKKHLKPDPNSTTNVDYINELSHFHVPSFLIFEIFKAGSWEIIIDV